MQIIRFSNYDSLSAYAADQIADAIKQNPFLVLCMASGHTPALTATLLAKKLIGEKIDYTRITFIGLDEWQGMPPENEGSCYHFFSSRLLEPLQLQPSQYFLFDGLTNDPALECRKMDAVIESKGGIDCMLVGIGMNGHIGFNEPGTPFTIGCHTIELDETTKTVGQKYFKEATALQQGITIGLGHLQKAKKVFLQANGERKKFVIQQTVEGPISPDFPASIMQQHPNGYILIDEEAASLLPS